MSIHSYSGNDLPVMIRCMYHDRDSRSSLYPGILVEHNTAQSWTQENVIRTCHTTPWKFFNDPVQLIVMVDEFSRIWLRYVSEEHIECLQSMPLLLGNRTTWSILDQAVYNQLHIGQPLPLDHGCAVKKIAIRYRKRIHCVDRKGSHNVPAVAVSLCLLCMDASLPAWGRTAAPKQSSSAGTRPQRLYTYEGCVFEKMIIKIHILMI